MIVVKLVMLILSRTAGLIGMISHSATSRCTACYSLHACRPKVVQAISGYKGPEVWDEASLRSLRISSPAEL